jgi:hypothetical protein
MIKFVPWLKICHPVILFKFWEPWRVVFGLNQVWAELNFILNFKFKLAHMSASSFALTRATRCLLSLSATVPLLPITCGAVCYYATCTPHSNTRAAIESTT